MVETFKSSKLFYGKYPFKIAYKRLYGFPKNDLLSDRWGITQQWWFDMPDDEIDRNRRDN